MPGIYDKILVQYTEYLLELAVIKFDKVFRLLRP
jgi:hypothetical protein